ncbi:OTU domain-containing protein 4-like isoform X2 [Mercenaria mercenaria]|uniref:OTU domain-containing protein 4-like isoform X2 n=1 Tax=Mercenaria mercenaria TaxID=6596 RepID=UPI00234F5A0C|nr:OTU domain-containing protein 4-like isoform X2 [Mercenaria mercenaria]
METDMKKQTKPEVFLDHYLSTLGLWRKPVARDGLSLFRAVSEQLFMTQTFHTNLYEACRIVFLHLGMDPETDWTEVEVIQILSRMYRRDFLVYENVGHPPYKASNNNYSKKILLCRIGETQLDSVYPASFQQDAAICQSIVYEILYRGVFKLDAELTEAVTLIRDQNKRKITLLSNRFDDLEDSCLKKFQDMHCSVKDRQLRKPSPPVPYRIAKALDPCIYRNVELDIWEEEKREQIKESPEYRERFAPGDKCQVILEGEHYHGHIQEISAEDNTAVVFIHELGEKKSVLISCLKTPPSPRYSCLSHSKYFKRKQDMPITSNTSGSYIYDNTTVKYPIYQPRSPVNQEVNYTSSNYQGYNLGTPYTYQGDVMANANSTGYIGMDTTPVQNTINNAKTNLSNQMSPPGVLQRYAPPVPAMLPQGAMTSPYVYNSLVPTSNQTYSCVCVPYLESIAVKDVNMHCLPSQDVAGKDLPEMNTLRFFFNLGVENYRLISHGGPMWPTVEMAPMVPPNGVVTQDQVNGNICGQACPTYPVSCPVYYAGPGSFSGAQAFIPPPNGVAGHGTYPQLCSMPPQVTQVQAMQTA